MRLALPFVLALALNAEIDRGIVKEGDGGNFYRNAQPTVARLGDGR